MGTSCIISMKNEDDSYTAIYNHYDGYPSDVLPILESSYSTRAKVKKLIAGGDLTTIADLSTRFNDKNSAPKNYHSKIVLINAAKNIGNYLYVFEDKAWKHIKM